MTSVITELIKRHCYADALFIAEHTLSQGPNGDEAENEVLNCLMHSGDVEGAYAFVKERMSQGLVDGKTPARKNRVLYARICSANGKYLEADYILSALTEIEAMTMNTEVDVATSVEWGTEYQLRGQVELMLGRSKQARDWFARAIHHCPYLTTSRSLLGENNADGEADSVGIVGMPNTSNNINNNNNNNNNNNSNIKRDSIGACATLLQPAIRTKRMRRGSITAVPSQSYGLDVMPVVDITLGLWNQYVAGSYCEVVRSWTSVCASDKDSKLGRCFGRCFGRCWMIAGMALYELRRYEEAQRHIDTGTRLLPHCRMALDIYSTVLWHLKKARALTRLAHGLVEQNKQSHHAWVALGNLFSLKNDHPRAQVYFERAVVLLSDRLSNTNKDVLANEGFVHCIVEGATAGGLSVVTTLLGFEYMHNEKLDEAERSFLQALRFNPHANYRAHFGLGLLTQHQAHPELALSHFARALKVILPTPTNNQLLNQDTNQDTNQETNQDTNRLAVASVYAYMGLSWASMRQYAEALLSLRKSLYLDTNNPLAGYHFVRIVLLASNDTSNDTSDDTSDGSHLDEQLVHEAGRLIDTLIERHPREHSFYLLKGDFEMHKNNRQNAISSYAYARDLNPHFGASLLKAALHHRPNNELNPADILEEL